jgi:hypothetical protein
MTHHFPQCSARYGDECGCLDLALGMAIPEDQLVRRLCEAVLAGPFVVDPAAHPILNGIDFRELARRLLGRSTAPADWPINNCKGNT